MSSSHAFLMGLRHSYVGILSPTLAASSEPYTKSLGRAQFMKEKIHDADVTFTSKIITHLGLLN